MTLRFVLVVFQPGPDIDEVCEVTCPEGPPGPKGDTVSHVTVFCLCMLHDATFYLCIWLYIYIYIYPATHIWGEDIAQLVRA